MIRKLNLVALFFCLLPVWTLAATYEVSTSIATVDGDTFCGGSACTSFDTIIIAGGPRGSLRFRDFNGNGSYITIMNEGANRVVITHDRDRAGVLEFANCKYIDFRGNNNKSYKYGIKVINDGSPRTPSGTVWIYGESDHIKLGYIEVDYTAGATGTSSSGLMVHDVNLTNSWTFNTFEIHHNYIHNTRYAGMYLGHNQPDPGQDDRPYTANFSIHDNILEDIGSYGMNLKGIIGGNNYIFKNTIKRTGQNCDAGSGAACSAEKMGDGYAVGMKILWTYGEAFVKIYDNWIEKTPGEGILVGEANHLVHHNTIVGCGFGSDNPKVHGHGITISTSDFMTNRPNRTLQIYENTIVEAARYGMQSNSGSAYHYRNIIAESGIGEVCCSYRDIVEGTGSNANIYEADADDVGFRVWSDDGDYSNDDFTLNKIPPATGLHIVK